MSPWLWLAGWWLISAVMFIGLWVYCRRRNNVGYIDIAWSAMICVGVVVATLMLEGEPTRRFIVGLMSGLWSLRLAVHLFKRIHGKQEDGRYKHMRSHFGDRASSVFLIFFQLQALFVVLFLSPIVAGLTRGGGLDWRDALGVGVWLIAFIGEAIADRQLALFKNAPGSAGQVCRRGLWRYSRHPNYFFEWVHWFAYLAIGARLGESIGYAALAGPGVMLLFLLFVTGIPYTEMRAVQSMGEAYRQYQRETSAFIPWFPKQERNR